MNNILENKNLCEAIIKYKDELDGYMYVPHDNINTIPIGAHIQYISKNNLKKKGGILKLIRDSYILEMKNYNKMKWYVYIDNYHLFYKIKTKPSLKSSLKDLVENDFSMEK